MSARLAVAVSVTGSVSRLIVEWLRGDAASPAAPRVFGREPGCLIPLGPDPASKNMLDDGPAC
jgi:hypothetical protein